MKERFTKWGSQHISAQPIGCTATFIFSIEEVQEMNRLADEIEAGWKKICPICKIHKLTPHVNFKLNDVCVCLSCFAKATGGITEVSDADKQSLAAIEKLERFRKKGNGYLRISVYRDGSPCYWEHVQLQGDETLPAVILALVEK